MISDRELNTKARKASGQAARQHLAIGHDCSNHHLLTSMFSSQLLSLRRDADHAVKIQRTRQAEQVASDLGAVHVHHTLPGMVA